MKNALNVLKNKMMHINDISADQLDREGRNMKN